MSCAHAPSASGSERFASRPPPAGLRRSSRAPTRPARPGARPTTRPASSCSAAPRTRRARSSSTAGSGSSRRCPRRRRRGCCPPLSVSAAITSSSGGAPASRLCAASQQATSCLEAPRRADARASRRSAPSTFISRAAEPPPCRRAHARDPRHAAGEHAGAGIGATRVRDRPALARGVGQPRPRVQRRAGAHEVAGERVERLREPAHAPGVARRRAPAACSAARPAASRDAERRCSVATSRSTPAARRRPAGSIAIRVIGAAPRGSRHRLGRLRLGRRGGLARGLLLALALAALLDGQLLGVAHQRGGERAQVGRDPAARARWERAAARVRSAAGPSKCTPSTAAAPRAPASATLPGDGAPLRRLSHHCCRVADKLGHVLSVATNPFGGQPHGTHAGIRIPARELPDRGAPGPGRHGCGL